MRKFGRTKDKGLGVLRTSQLITSFGIGAIVDLRDETVILAGADKWYVSGDSRAEERKLRCHNLENILKKKFFVKPKSGQSQNSFALGDVSRDIQAYRFPNVLYCPKCMRLFDDVTTMQEHVRCPDCTKGKRGPRLVPSRFVIVCPRGHIEDFPYDEWVHEGKACPSRKGTKKDLKLKNLDGRTSISSLYVICEDCKKMRSMEGAFSPNALSQLHPCSGRRPWLDEDDPISCDGTMTIRNRTASGVYFPANVSALNIPPWNSKISQALQGHLSALEYMESKGRVAYIEKEIAPSLPGAALDAILETWETLRPLKDIPATRRELYEEEYRALRDGVADDLSDLCSLPRAIPQKYQGLISRVMAVTRLTEIVAMVGFTRVSKWDGDVNDKRLAPIFTHDQPWLPAIDMHGEGIFIELNEARVREWEAKNKSAYSVLLGQASEENASGRYILLHTLAHLLIRALAVDCGYNVSSMKERIYSTYPRGGQAMSGILVYTTSTDADGSLGGLMEQSVPERLEAHIDALLEDAEWCSSDPLCMSSAGEHAVGANHAACPQCTFLPETSCVLWNSLLDRGAIIGRKDGASCTGYFEGALSS